MGTQMDYSWKGSGLIDEWWMDGWMVRWTADGMDGGWREGRRMGMCMVMGGRQAEADSDNQIRSFEDIVFAYFRLNKRLLHARCTGGRCFKTKSWKIHGPSPTNSFNSERRQHIIKHKSG